MLNHIVMQCFTHVIMIFVSKRDSKPNCTDLLRPAAKSWQNRGASASRPHVLGRSRAAREPSTTGDLPRNIWI